MRKPDIVLIHGDTTTSFATALAAFYQQIPVGHVETGLRIFDKYSPFLEEMNCSLTVRIAELHYAHTENNRKNLANENMTDNVFITVNTLIDAIRIIVKPDYQYRDSDLCGINFTRKHCILMTVHRRENLGQPLEHICRAIKHFMEDFQDTEVVYLVHMNPAVRDTAAAILGGLGRAHLIYPLDVEDMHNLMSWSSLVKTDSGNLQEEAPSCGVPILVLSTKTERLEAVGAGKVKGVSVDEDVIYEDAKLLLPNLKEYDKMKRL